MVRAPASRVLKPSAAARDHIPSIGNDVLALINDDRRAFIVNSEIIAVGCDEFPIAYLNGRVTRTRPVRDRRTGSPPCEKPGHRHQV